MQRVFSTVQLYKDGSLHNSIHTTGKNLETDEIEYITAAKFNFLAGKNIWTTLYQKGINMWEDCSLKTRQEIENELPDKAEKIFVFIGKIINKEEVEKFFSLQHGILTPGRYAVAFNEKGKPSDYRKIDFKEEIYITIDSIEELKVMYKEITGYDLINEENKVTSHSRSLKNNQQQD